MDKVRTEDLERLDKPDFDAIQDLVEAYLGRVIGGLMGMSSGVISCGKGFIDTSDYAASNKVTIGGDALLYFGKMGADGLVDGKIVRVKLVDLSSSDKEITITGGPASTTVTVSTITTSETVGTAVQSEAEVYSHDAVGKNSIFIWAKETTASANTELRRKWDVATSTEVSVSVSTRTQAKVAFSFTLTERPPNHTDDWILVARPAFDGGYYRTHAEYGLADQTSNTSNPNLFSDVEAIDGQPAFPVDSQALPNSDQYNDLPFKARTAWRRVLNADGTVFQVDGDDAFKPILRPHYCWDTFGAAGVSSTGASGLGTFDYAQAGIDYASYGEYLDALNRGSGHYGAVEGDADGRVPAENFGALSGTAQAKGSDPSADFTDENFAKPHGYTSSSTATNPGGLIDMLYRMRLEIARLKNAGDPAEGMATSSQSTATIKDGTEKLGDRFSPAGPWWDENEGDSWYGFEQGRWQAEVNKDTTKSGIAAKGVNLWRQQGVRHIRRRLIEAYRRSGEVIAWMMGIGNWDAPDVNAVLTMRTTGNQHGVGAQPTEPTNPDRIGAGLGGRLTYGGSFPNLAAKVRNVAARSFKIAEGKFSFIGGNVHHISRTGDSGLAYTADEGLEFKYRTSADADTTSWNLTPDTDSSISADDPRHEASSLLREYPVRIASPYSTDVRGLKYICHGDNPGQVWFSINDPGFPCELLNVQITMCGDTYNGLEWWELSTPVVEDWTRSTWKKTGAFQRGSDYSGDALSPGIHSSHALLASMPEGGRTLADFFSSGENILANSSLTGPSKKAYMSGGKPRINFKVFFPLTWASAWSSDNDSGTGATGGTRGANSSWWDSYNITSSSDQGQAFAGDWFGVPVDGAAPVGSVGDGGYIQRVTPRARQNNFPMGDSRMSGSIGATSYGPNYSMDKWPSFYITVWAREET